MTLLTVNQLADKLAINEIAAIPKDARSNQDKNNAHGRALTKLAQEIEAGMRKAWVRGPDGFLLLAEDHALFIEIKNWLDGDRVKTVKETRYNDITRSQRDVNVRVFVNDCWKNDVYVADESDVSSWPFMKKDHKNFAPELEAAVSAWLALYSDESHSASKGNKDRVGKWIRSNRPDALSKARDDGSKAIARIATVINPRGRKDGGAVPT